LAVDYRSAGGAPCLTAVKRPEKASKCAGHREDGVGDRFAALQVGQRERALAFGERQLLQAPGEIRFHEDLD
jgi:hypothetical protein